MERTGYAREQEGAPDWGILREGYMLERRNLEEDSEDRKADMQDPLFGMTSWSWLK